MQDAAEEKDRKIKELEMAHRDLLKKINENVSVFNKKLEKNKVNMVTEFVSKQETKRIHALQDDFVEQHKDITEHVLGKNLELKKIMVEKHRTVVMREMLQTDTMINFDEISLHESDGTNIISSTDKKLSELEQRIEKTISHGSLTLSKLSHRLSIKDTNDFYQSDIKNLLQNRKGESLVNVPD